MKERLQREIVVNELIQREKDKTTNKFLCSLPETNPVTAVCAPRKYRNFLMHGLREDRG